jgi:hypothetical protein
MEAEKCGSFLGINVSLVVRDSLSATGMKRHRLCLGNGVGTVACRHWLRISFANCSITEHARTT